MGCSPYAGEKSYEEPSQKLEGLDFSEKRAGVVQWELTSAAGTMMEEQGLALLAQPRLALYQEGKLSSRAQAAVGVIHTRSHEIELSTGVIVRSVADGATLKTEQLLYSPEKNKVYSDKAVTVDRPDGHLEGQGIEATPDLSEVRIKKQRTTLKK